jgi:hypothetical protein
MRTYPINLSNLPLATAQDVFDQAVDHLLEQGEKCLQNNWPVYRNKEGLACAAAS